MCEIQFYLLLLIDDNNVVMGTDPRYYVNAREEHVSELVMVVTAATVAATADNANEYCVLKAAINLEGISSCTSFVWSCESNIDRTEPMNQPMLYLEASENIQIFILSY